MYSEGFYGVDPIVTVSNGPDNGSLDCMAKRFKNTERHSSTKMAVDNLVKHLKEELKGKSKLIIGGHGDDGFFTTGSGQTGTQTMDNSVATYNESKHWGPEFDRLKPKNYPILEILSCHTGAGQDGADLLYAIAKRINHAVRARTGLTSCGSNGITYEDGSTWQVATPDQKPNPIPRPHKFFKPSKGIVIMVDKKFKTMKMDEVLKIEVIRHQRTGTISDFVEGEYAKALMTMIDWDNPFEHEGQFAAVISVSLVLTLKDSSTKKIDIYNFRIAQDGDNPTIYYNVSSNLRNFIARI